MPTPRVSSRWRVAGTSRIDFTPAQTTVIPVLASSRRSADSSWFSAHSRCTPPSPPVAKTPTPARAARNAVADTVVAPLAPAASAGARSRCPSLRTVGSPAIRSNWFSPRPTWARPSRTATVAGTAPHGPDDPLQLPGHGQVARARQTVRDDRRLQCHDGRTGAQGGAHLRREHGFVGVRLRVLRIRGTLVGTLVRWVLRHAPSLSRQGWAQTTDGRPVVGPGRRVAGSDR